MNADIEDLARLLPAPPTGQLTDDRRRRLRAYVMNETVIRQRSVAWTRRRQAVVAGMLAVAALGAASYLVDPIGDGRARALFPPAGDQTQSSSFVDVNGQQLLLAAAEVAGRTPDAPGRYWHVRVTVSPDDSYDTWFDHDSRMWVRSAKTGGSVMDLGVDPFYLDTRRLTLDQIQALPTTPTELLAWITDAVDHPDPSALGNPPKSRNRDEFVLYSLISLVSELPAPSAVRAAAFRAIATYPGVRIAGTVPGGVALDIASIDGGGAHLVLDPATSKITRTDFYVQFDGAIVSSSSLMQLTAEWTDDLA
jgi:hypothetical protein